MSTVVDDPHSPLIGEHGTGFGIHVVLRMAQPREFLAVAPVRRASIPQTPVAQIGCETGPIYGADGPIRAIAYARRAEEST